VCAACVVRVDVSLRTVPPLAHHLVALPPPRLRWCRYGEHVLKHVFKLDRLDMGAVAASFGLVKLPKVKELRGKDVGLHMLIVSIAHLHSSNPAHCIADRLRRHATRAHGGGRLC